MILNFIPKSMRVFNADEHGKTKCTKRNTELTANIFVLFYSVSHYSTSAKKIFHSIAL